MTVVLILLLTSVLAGWMVDRLCRPTFTELVEEMKKMVGNPLRYLVLKVCTCSLLVCHLNRK